MNAYKRFCLSFLGVVGVLFLMCCAVGVLLWVYDPFMFFHKPYFRDISFSNEMRLQNKGIIKHYDFDSFILGSSMLRNTSAKEASEKLGGKWVNISIDGGAFNERAVVLQYLFREKPNTKHIIGSLDGHEWIGEADTKRFAFLYDKNEFNDLKAYLNMKTILCALSYSKKPKCVGEKDLEILTNWAKETFHNARFGGFHKWLENKDNKQIEHTIKDLQKMTNTPPYKLATFDGSIKESQDMLEANILQFVRQNPNTRFDFMFPTYSRLSYRILSSSHAKTKVVLKWLVKEAQNLPNMKIYGLDDLDYADNIANYKDLTHYNIDMNSMQLDAIKNGTHILTPENIDEYLATMESKIKAYDISPLIKEIKEWEQNASMK